MTQNTWFVAGFLIAFLILLEFGLKFWRRPEVPAPIAKELQTEGFLAPTSILQCRCLPGYQPSNTKTSARRGVIRVIPNKLNDGRTIYWPFYTFDDTKQVHLMFLDRYPCMPGYNVNDVLFTNSINAPIFTESELRSGIWKDGGVFQCSILDQQTTELSPTYFCQSLNDPTKTRECY